MRALGEKSGGSTYLMGIGRKQGRAGVILCLAAALSLFASPALRKTAWAQEEWASPFITNDSLFVAPVSEAKINPVVCLAGGVAVSTLLVVIVAVGVALGLDASSSGSAGVHRTSDPDIRTAQASSSRMGGCSYMMKSVQFSASGANTLDSKNMLQGRGGLEGGFSAFSYFELDTSVLVGGIRVPPPTDDRDTYVGLGERLRFYPLKVEQTNGVLFSPYAVGGAIAGWNNHGPNVGILEYGGGLDIGYGSGAGVLSLFGEGLMSYANSGGSIYPMDRHWKGAPTVMIGLRFRGFDF